MYIVRIIQDNFKQLHVGNCYVYTIICSELLVYYPHSGNISSRFSKAILKKCFHEQIAV